MSLPVSVNPNLVSTKYLNNKDNMQVPSSSMQYVRFMFDLKNMVIWFERAI